MSAYVLSEADLKLLKEMAEEHRRRKQTPRQPVAVDDPYLPPEVYVARTPAGGIPALDTTPGTATASLDTEDQPGKAECEIYKVVYDGDTPLLHRVEGLSRVVHNLSVGAVPPDTWVLIHRDKFGKWFVGGAASGDSELPPCEGPGWISGLSPASCVKLQVLTVGPGECREITTSQVFYAKTLDGTTWEMSTAFKKTCNGVVSDAAKVTFTRPFVATDSGQPILRTAAFTGCDGVATTGYEFVFQCATDSALYYRGGAWELLNRQLCNASRSTSLPAVDHSFLLKLTESTCCPNPDYTGPGWYCADGVCEYLDYDPCTDRHIFGPYASEAVCDENCGDTGTSSGATTVTCDSCNIPLTLTATITGCVPTSVTLVYNAGTLQWVGAAQTCDDFTNWIIRMRCNAGVLQLQSSGGTWINVSSLSCPGSVFASATFSIPADACCPSGGTVVVTP